MPGLGSAMATEVDGGERTAAHDGDAPRARGWTGGCLGGRGAHHGDKFMLGEGGGGPERCGDGVDDDDLGVFPTNVVDEDDDELGSSCSGSASERRGGGGGAPDGTILSSNGWRRWGA